MYMCNGQRTCLNKNKRVNLMLSGVDYYFFFNSDRVRFLWHIRKFSLCFSALIVPVLLSMRLAVFCCSPVATPFHLRIPSVCLLIPCMMTAGFISQSISVFIYCGLWLPLPPSHVPAVAVSGGKQTKRPLSLSVCTVLFAPKKKMYQAK